MPRRRSPPRLYLDPTRRQWVIRDGPRLVRTGCAESDRHGAEARLAAYLGQKHTPQRGPSPLIADILLAYASEHLPHTRAAKNAAYNIGNLSAWWGDKKLSDVTARNCRAYAENKSPAAARRDLETLRAAIGHWHREYGPLPSVPVVVLPPKPAPARRWLTRSEVARLLGPPAERRILRASFSWASTPEAAPGFAGTALVMDRPCSWSHVAPRSRNTGIKKRTPPVKLGSRIQAHLRRWRRLDGTVSTSANTTDNPS